jgi:signal transduction histidine kinase
MALCGILFSRGAERWTTRIFRPAGSYAANLSLSPGSTVVCKSGENSVATILDGYSQRDVRLPEESTYRVYMSRSGQLWTLAPNGLWLLSNGSWTLHPIADIRFELQSYPLSQLHQISLLPAEVNHVLILLHDRLLDFDATSGQVRLLKEARNTSLGEFSEIQEGADGSVWISGALGMAKLQGPARRIAPQTPWSESLLPNPNQINGLQRPFEFPAGTVTVCANPMNGENQRFVAELQNDSWSFLPAGGEKIRQAWRDTDGLIWAYSANSLYRFDSAPSFSIHKEPVPGSQYDMAAETNGVFWIASSEGLVRYAPFLWRSPPALQEVQASVHAIVFDRTNAWLATPEGLMLARPGLGHQLFPWPEEIESMVPPRESLFLLPDGRLVVSAQNQPYIFSPDTRAFSRLRTPAAVRVHLLGQMLDGSVCASLEHNTSNAPPDLRLFDGKSFTAFGLPLTNSFAELSFVRELSKGDIWIGSGTELLHYRANSGALEVHGLDRGLGMDRILAIGAAGEGRIWCGTATRVYEYRGRRWETIFNTQDRVTSITAAAGSVWVGTAAGLYRYYQDSWIQHGINEGVPSGPVYALRSGPNDLLWAGTSRGAIVFHPDADLDPPHTYPPVLENAQKPSTLVPLEIKFRAMDKWNYTPGNDLLFSYKLDEGGWTAFSNVTGRVFQNLSSGSHVLELVAMDRNGNKSPFPSKAEFSVIVPWFRDPRLIVVSVLALCAILVLAGFAVNSHFQLKRSYAQVEKIVAQRTKELERANQELLHSQKMRAIGTMAAGIAHDFNNILSIIKGSAQIIESSAGDQEKIRTRVSRIQTVVEQGTSIVKALLGLGRSTEQTSSDCNMEELLRETRALISDRFPESLRIEIDAAADLPQVTCSSEVLQQMLLNFVLNAADAMSNEGVVRLSARALNVLPQNMALMPAPAESYTALSVTDQGTGISEEILPRIFEPFFTTKAFSSRRGTGLGLSMAYELAKGLGYGLAIETEPGAGTTFSIILPANRGTGSAKRGGPAETQGGMHRAKI